MRISELSRRSGRSIATIKYYLREGLLPAGHRTSANQADYGEGHLRRLRLITILLEVGGLSITSIKIVVDAIDDESRTMHEVLGAAHHALALRVATPVALPEHDEAETEIDEYVRTLGWNVKADAPDVGSWPPSWCRCGGWAGGSTPACSTNTPGPQTRSPSGNSPAPPTTPTERRPSRRWSSAPWRSRRHWSPCVAWPKSTTRPPVTSTGDAEAGFDCDRLLRAGGRLLEEHAVPDRNASVRLDNNRTQADVISTDTICFPGFLFRSRATGRRDRSYRSAAYRGESPRAGGVANE